MKIVLLSAALIAASASLASAQPMMPMVDLPEICGSTMPMQSGQDFHDIHDGHGAPSMSPGHAAMNAGLDEMHAAMTEGMKAEDLDVAFICGMIPHHMGAIVMAKAQLEYGEDEWVKSLSRNIIEAQEREVAEMLEWLNSR